MIGGVLITRFSCIVAALSAVSMVSAQATSGSRRGGDDESGHWAFRPVAQEPVPTPRVTGWARGPVDRFLAFAMERVGARPARASQPRALVRRLHYDLIGLPPTPEAVEAFLKDPTDLAFSQMVDTLIASPQFGERWGRHWLDVVRFAESSGGGRSLMFKNAWRFRDYVIESYNADRPFDQFLREQIAGDLMPSRSDEQYNRQIVATAFLELGPTNYELQDKQLLRMDVIDEQIDTVGRVFLGMTLGCARCHDHKFDPVPMEDYYAMAGIFGSTQILTSGNVSGHVELELRGPASRAYRAHQKRKASVKKEAQALRKLAKGAARGGARSDLSGILVDDAAAVKKGAWVESQHVRGYLDAGYIHDDNKSKGSKSVRFVADLPSEGEYTVRLLYTAGGNRATNVPVEISHADGTDRVYVNQREKGAGGGRQARLGTFRFRRGRHAGITIATGGTDGHVIVDGVQLIPLDPPTSQAGREAAAKARELVARRRDRLADLEAELARLEKAAPPGPLMAMAVRDVAKPKDGHVHLRGLVRTLGKVVPRGFLTVCGDARPKIPAGESGRQQLADWLADPGNPLVARVYVNRVWHHVFGAGLVRTVDNFGKMGERPSHPELLDWLAGEFVRTGWSTKALIRQLVMSAAYRASPAESPASDPENRLLSHANRRRLDVESLRDSILVISGELDSKMGGSTIRKFSTYDYDYAYSSKRRTVYVPMFRGTRMDIFEIFDGADPNLVTGRRAQSQVSTQALYLMNSSWLMQQADLAARRLLRKAEGPGMDDLVSRVYLRALGRPPAAEERRLASDFIAQFAPGDREKAVGQLFHTLFACIDFRYLD